MRGLRNEGFAHDAFRGLRQRSGITDPNTMTTTFSEKTPHVTPRPAMPARLAAFALLLAALLAACAPPAWAQTTGDGDEGPAARAFHAAARQYLAGDAATALETVEAGLSAAPDDPQLTTLRATLLRRQRQPDDGDGDGQDGAPGQQDGEGEGQGQTDGQPDDVGDEQGGADGDPQDGDPQGGDPQGGEDADGEGGQPPPGDPQGSERPGAPSDDASDGAPGDPDSARPGATPGQAGSAEAGGAEAGGAGGGAAQAGDGAPEQQGLSRAQAERILRALEGQEKKLLRQVQRRNERPLPVEKDW